MSRVKDCLVLGSDRRARPVPARSGWSPGRAPPTPVSRGGEPADAPPSTNRGGMEAAPLARLEHLQIVVTDSGQIKTVPVRVSPSTRAMTGTTPKRCRWTSGRTCCAIRR
jgi:phage replication initiation protein